MKIISRKMNIISRCSGLYRTAELSDTELIAGHVPFLFAVCRTPGLSQDQLARRLCFNKSTVTRRLAYLEEHAFDPGLRIEDACNAGFMSTSGMYRSFYACFGMSAKSYLNKMRMSRALTLLAQDAYSILEIAEACGFNDVKYFSKAFKATYGCSPSHFKNNITV
jgi:AraC-like DNA-binding protein